MKLHIWVRENNNDDETLPIEFRLTGNRYNL